jgi:hypothetical protein
MRHVINHLHKSERKRMRDQNFSSYLFNFFSLNKTNKELFKNTFSYQKGFFLI